MDAMSFFEQGVRDAHRKIVEIEELRLIGEGLEGKELRSEALAAADRGLRKRVCELLSANRDDGFGAFWKP